MPGMKLTQAAIRLRRMAFYAYHGVLDQERAVGGDIGIGLRAAAGVDVQDAAFCSPSALLP